MKRFKSRRSYIGGLVAVCICAATVAVLVGSASAGSARVAADSEISVTMGKPKEYSLKLNTSSAKAGEVALTVRNRGKITHEFILLRTPTKAGKLPARAEEPDKVVEPGFMIELEDVEPGDRVTVVMPMKKGHYVLLCNIEGHYHDGMRADLTLR
jgi:uncharacterized cupredoxin-like copper-binding protein